VRAAKVHLKEEIETRKVDLPEYRDTPLPRSGSSDRNVIPGRLVAMSILSAD